jgi:hypothetical protein
MNDDNDENRRTVEQCYRTRKTMVNPIVDWSDEDVWDFLNSNNIPHCCLYDEGFTRLGCIGCPLAGKKNMERDFERWPKYKELYIRAFQRMIDNHPGQIKILDPNAETKFKLEIDGGGYNGSTTGSTSADTTRLHDMVHGELTENSMGGGTSRTSHAGKMVQGHQLLNTSSTIGNETAATGQHGLRPRSAIAVSTLSGGRYVYEHWVEMGAM